MKFSIPEQMPSRIEFVSLFFDAIFPDLKNGESTPTGYACTAACDQAAIETGLKPSNDLVEDSRVFRLMYELAEMSKSLFNKKPSLFANKETYKTYSDTLDTFCSQESGIWKSWLRQTNSNSRVNLSFEAALFFTFILLNRQESVYERKPFFEKCLEYLGITDIEETVSYKLFHFDWEELGSQGLIGERTFTRLDNKAIILLGAVVLTIFELIGRYSVDRDQGKLEKLYNKFEAIFENDIYVAKAIDEAEKTFYKCNRYLIPRSIQTTDLRPQDVFVFPEFEVNNKKCDNPISVLKESFKSSRQLIVAKTGMGKSAFLQMASLCMLAERYGIEDMNQPEFQKIASKLDAPEDMFIISVPASMFSFCFKDEQRYRDWTADFVTLFFNCMWRLSEWNNFYTNQSSQQVFKKIEQSSMQDNCVTEELSEYVQELARRGKLLLILDSFDEIAAGKMRTAYLKCVAQFCDKYCSYPEMNEAGAHVIISSRQMSPDTMQSLKQALEIDFQIKTYGICSFNDTQRSKLVLKWSRYLDISEEKSNKIIDTINTNHFYSDYSINPYMLSVVCFNFDFDLGMITQRFIDFLIERMIRINRVTQEDKYGDGVIMGVLMNIRRILQDVAGETVTNGNAHFSKGKLNRYLRRQIDKTELTEEDVESYIERLHEIFVTQVGLIVPADGADEDYQFINNQIRFELASKGFQRVLDREEQILAYREVIFPSITDMDEYTGLIVPLICDINLKNVQLAELLVSDLVMYDFKTDEEERILIRTMLDLLLCRYGINIATVSDSGEKIAKYVLRAQRMLLMRVFTSRNFKPTKNEKEELVQSPAFRSNVAWFSKNVASLLN